MRVVGSEPAVCALTGESVRLPPQPSQRCATGNPGMSTPYNQSFANDYAEFLHNKMFRVAWNMAATVSNTRTCPFALPRMLAVLIP